VFQQTVGADLLFQQSLKHPGKMFQRVPTEFQRSNSILKI